jgi:hypothetical protein
LAERFRNYLAQHLTLWGGGEEGGGG